MQLIKFNGNILEMDDRIDEMTYHNYMMYNMSVMMDSGIGSDLNSFTDRLNDIVAYATRGDMEGLNKCVQNTQMCYQFIMMQTSPEMASFIWMIKTINGEPIGELTDERIKILTKELSRKGLTVAKVKGFLNSLKKKIQTQFDIFLPNWVDKTGLKYLAHLKKRTALVLEGVMGSDVEAKIMEIDDLIFGMSKPKGFSGAQGVQVQSFLNYNSTSTLLKQKGLGDPKKMTVVETLQALDILKKQLKPSKK